MRPYRSSENIDSLFELAYAATKLELEKYDPIDEKGS
jgi:hypothetical protein